MKTLFVLRHAKAERESGTGRDFDRPLAARGLNDAEAVGRQARAQGLTFDHVSASPALRVRQTLESFAGGYGKLPNPAFDEELYGAGSLWWLEIVRQLPETVHAPLIAGHNPSLHHLVYDLTDGAGGTLRDRIASSYPTGALAGIGVDIGQWSDLGPGRGELTTLILPGDLRG